MTNTGQEMLDTFSKLLPFLKGDRTKTDNRVFRLHCQLTVGFLLICVVLVSIQLTGTPISCHVNDNFDKDNSDIMNTFCWIQSTYTIPHAIPSDGSGAYPGVGPLIPASNHTLQHRHDDTIKYHTYYQWVVFVLLFQAILFYAPKFIWTMWEDDLLKMLAMGLHEGVEKMDDERKTVVNYFLRTIQQNGKYFYYFVVCEILNFVNVVTQIYFTDLFLGHEFTTYGTRVLDFMDKRPELRNDPMNVVFPKVTKCTFNIIGATGNIVNNDGLCILQVNIYNEKIYVFLWFWFIILAAITGLWLIYRIATLLSRQVRCLCLKRTSHTSSNRDLKKIVDHFQVGDWFILCQLSQNMDPVVYHKFIEDLSKKDLRLIIDAKKTLRKRV